MYIWQILEGTRPALTTDIWPTNSGGSSPTMNIIPTQVCEGSIDSVSTSKRKQAETCSIFAVSKDEFDGDSDEAEFDVRQVRKGKPKGIRLLEDELTWYMDEGRVDLRSSSEAVLRLWGANRLFYPTLYRTACAYLAMTTTSICNIRARVLRRREHRHEKAKQAIA